jgi:hypothetical protein
MGLTGFETSSYVGADCLPEEELDAPYAPVTVTKGPQRFGAGARSGSGRRSANITRAPTSPIASSPRLIAVAVANEPWSPRGEPTASPGLLLW